MRTETGRMVVAGRFLVGLLELIARGPGTLSVDYRYGLDRRISPAEATERTRAA
jgi:hypothetical protein